MKVSASPTSETVQAAPSETPTTPERPEPIIPPSLPPAKPATWPDWFGVADLAMMVLVVIAAFGCASFAAKNSDLWYHLAAGRLMAEGKSTFGVDPFSYMTEGRMWVNHNWLWDRVAYLMYQSDSSGAWLVGIKAVLYALSFVVLMLLRRSGAALWPWAVMAGLAVLAGGNIAQLRPFVMNPLFIALTLLVLFRFEWKPGSWRNPILLAVLFGIWANVDSCFVLGPAAVLLVLIGELVQRALLKGKRDDPGAFGTPPPVSGLAKALLIGAVACMANPHHVHVWQMPFEYGAGLPSAGMIKDAELFTSVLEPYSELFWDKTPRGKNLNGAAYLLLFALSGLAMAISFGKLRVAHLFIWLLFGYLSLHQWQFILPFSIVSAAIAAAYLNLWSSGIALQSKDQPKTRAYLLGSSVGRFVTITLAIIMVSAAWPGWLHPPTNAIANPRRVAWAIEPDEGMIASAKVIQGWREKGLLAPEVRGFTPNLDFANYLAFYAPGEKVFANGRYPYHAAEIPDVLSARQDLYFDTKPSPEGGLDLSLVRQAMTKANASYLAVISQAVRMSTDGARTIELTPGWSVWHIGGRGVVAGPESQTKLAFDPAAELLGPSVGPLPEVLTIPPPAPRESWLDDFLRRPKGSPSSIDDALSLFSYSQFLTLKSNFDHNQKTLAACAVIGGMAGLRNRIPTDAELATPILAIRAARIALADNPDLPDAYFTLAQIYSLLSVPELFTDNPQLGRTGEIQLQLISALRRFLARMPLPEQCNPSQAEKAFIACEQLSQHYLKSRQIDFARDLCAAKKKYFLASFGLEYQKKINQAGQNAEQAKAIKAEFDSHIKHFDDTELQIDKQIADVSDQIRNQKILGTQKFFALTQSGLPGTAIKTFDDVPETDYQNEYGQDTVIVALAVVDLLTRSGQVERAVAQLERLTKSIEETAKDPKTDPGFTKQLKAQVVEREFRLRALEGNYRAAADALERMNTNHFKPFSPALLAAARGEAMESSLALGVLPFVVLHQPLALIVNRQLAAESEFAYGRALLAVYDGNAADAKTRFAQCLAPQGVKGMPYPWAPLANRFIAMIERVSRP